jgi:hypothetical protein
MRSMTSWGAWKRIETARPGSRSWKYVVAFQ